MGPKVRYYYFSGKGRGEMGRLMLACAGVNYEDIRFEKDEWDNKFKAQSPFGQCPWLEIDDGHQVIKLCQSYDIVRYLAKQCDLAGGDDLLEQALVEMIAESCEDYIVKPCIYIRREQDPKEKKEKIRVFEHETLPKFLAKLEEICIENGGKYFVGNKLSYADIIWAHWMLWVPQGVEVEPPLDKYPHLKALKARAEAHPPVAKWMKERPVTDL